MSCPLPHVPVLLNLSRRSALRFGEASRRVIHPLAAVSACLPRVLLSSARPLSSRLSTRQAERLAICVGSVCDCGGRADVVRRMAACSSVRLRPACVHRPAPPTRVAGRGRR